MSDQSSRPSLFSRCVFYLAAGLCVFACLELALALWTTIPIPDGEQIAWIGWSLLLELTALVSGLAVFFAATERPKRTVPRRWIASFLICAAALGVWKLRTIADSPKRALHRADRVVAAISSYERDHSRPPESLADLYPQYLSFRPEKLTRTYHTHYQRFDNAPHWSLTVWGSLFFSGASFDYRPAGSDPELSKGRVQIRDWAGLFHN